MSLTWTAPPASQSENLDIIRNIASVMLITQLGGGMRDIETI